MNIRTTPSQIADEARQTVNDALDATEHKLHELRRDIEPAIQQITNRFQHAVQDGLHAASAGKARAARRLDHAAVASGRLVAAQPVRSVLAAAAAGAAIAALIMRVNRR